MYLDVACVSCGTFHHNGRTPQTCPHCHSRDIVVTPHNYDIDRRFKEERENMLDRMDIE
jgi:Zn finger protein HypA/HybF involved in hydrogenase expression